MDGKQVIKSTQEQAIASWVNYLNETRLARMSSALCQEQKNFDNAIDSVNKALEKIQKEIVYNGKGRGGKCGMHGFIAEIAECGIGNAREQIEGKLPVYEWINDNGPADLSRSGISIQQKFVQSGNHLSLQAIKMHLSKYPEYLKKGGKYQIPEDHYAKIKWLLSISKEKAYKMPTSTGEFSLKQWQEVHDFFASDIVPLGSIEPSFLKYDEVQKGSYENRFDIEKGALQKRTEERKDIAKQKGKPSFHEGVKTSVVSAFTEGGMEFCMAIIAKKRDGKRIKDFDENDWKEIAEGTGSGFAKGGIRGVSLYALTNFIRTPAAVASTIVTASFGVAEQAYKFRNGELDEASFVENSESICLDAAVSALSSFAGQILIPVPALGAVIGNAVGTLMYQIAKDSLSEREMKILGEYANSMSELKGELQEQYQSSLNALSESMCRFMIILDMAFEPDIRVAFSGSVELAKMTGVPVDEILDSKEKVTEYFLD